MILPHPFRRGEGLAVHDHGRVWSGAVAGLSVGWDRASPRLEVPSGLRCIWQQGEVIASRELDVPQILLHSLRCLDLAL